MSYQIQLRSDTANNWTTVNPVLAQAEAGYETDTNQLKFGDGANAWVALPYFGGNGGGGNYSNANVLSYLASANVGNIIPSGNAVYSLGNATNQWKDLWVSNATIYLNSVPLSMTSNADLTFNGNPVVTTNTSTGNTTTAGNIAITGNVTANSFTYANGAAIVSNQPVWVQSNIATVNPALSISVAVDYANTTYPGGVFTIYQPTSNVIITGSSIWATGGTSKDAYTDFANSVVNSQNVDLTLSITGGTFNVLGSDTITIGSTTITGANLTGLGISGTGGTYIIPASMVGSAETAASSPVTVNLSTSSGQHSASCGTLTTIAATPFAFTSLTAAWANASVPANTAQTFSWTASGFTGTITAGNVTLSGYANTTLSSNTATSGTSPSIVSSVGPYNLSATYTGFGSHGSGNISITVPYTLAPTAIVAPLYYKTTSSSANPNFTSSDPNFGSAFTLPSVSMGAQKPANAQGMTTSSSSTVYNWLAIPGGSGTWFWQDSPPSTGSTNIYACFDQGTFYQIVLGTPTAPNGGASYFTTINGVPYTVVGWAGFNSAQFLYLVNIV